jgi:hypothetical protein
MSIHTTAEFKAAALARVHANAEVFPPNEVQRATGTFGLPRGGVGQFYDPSEDDANAIVISDEPKTGPVLLMLVGSSRNGYHSAVVGPFPSPEAASSWWDAPFNRLGQESRDVIEYVCIIPAAAEDGAAVQTDLFDLLAEPAS